MLSPYLKRIVIDALLLIAFVLGIFYAYKVFIDFLISLFHFEGTINLSSIAYCVQRALLIIVPIIMLTMSKSISKIKIFKCIYMIVGICYLLGNTWVIYYVINNSPMDLIYGSIPKWFGSGKFGEIMTTSWGNMYVFQYNNAMVFNYLVWDSYDLFGVVFSTIQGILYIKLSLDMDTSRAKVMKLFFKTTVLSLALPLLYNILVQKRVFMTTSWMSRNILLAFESLFVLGALQLAASSRNFWHDVLW